MLTTPTHPDLEATPPPDRQRAPAQAASWGHGWKTEADHKEARQWLLSTLRDNQGNQAVRDQAVAQGVLEINAEGEYVATTKPIPKKRAIALKHFLTQGPTK